jgi:ADP-ribosylglycohydrolase
MQYKNRVYGCVVGGAIGDALGAPVENWSYHRIREEYGKIKQFQAYDSPFASGDPGTVTDDTVMSQYLSLAIIETGGRVTPDEYADILVKHLDPERVWITEEIAYLKLLGGLNPWRTGRANVPAGTGANQIGPIGIINAGNPRQAYQDGFTIAGINQDGIEQDAAATVAAGVAQALAPETSIDAVLEVMLEQSSDILFRTMELTMAIVDESETVDEFLNEYYGQMLDWRWPAVEWDRERYQAGEIFSGSSIEIVPLSMAILRLCSDDPNQALIEAASSGRDCDTISCLVGNIHGAVHGADSLREDWIEQCESANQEFLQELYQQSGISFEEAAKQMIGCLENERDRSSERVNTLDEILGSSE